MNRNYIISIVLIVIFAGILTFLATRPSVSTTTAASNTPNASTNDQDVDSTQSQSATPQNGTAPVENTGNVGNPNASNPYPPQTVQVNYTKNGFSPTSIVIHTGDTVVFLNQSPEAMWVMSDPSVHPSYPGFDENQSVSNGGSYSILFTTAGTYDYYNQVQQTRKGTIIVQPLP